MMKPAGEGVKNNLYEYALTGLASYASANPQCVDKVREGFAQAVKVTTDSNNKAFLLNLFRQIAKPADAQFFKEYVNDPALASTAVGALVDIPGTEDLILDLVKEGTADRKLLATAAAEKGIFRCRALYSEMGHPDRPEFHDARQRLLLSFGCHRLRVFIEYS